MTIVPASGLSRRELELLGNNLSEAARRDHRRMSSRDVKVQGDADDQARLRFTPIADFGRRTAG